MPGLPDLLHHIHSGLLPELRIHCLDPHDPVQVLELPRPWHLLGCGNYAAVLHHPRHPDRVVKVYGPGRPGLEQEAEVYRRIGSHPAFSRCFHMGEGYLVLRRLHGTTLYDCLRHASSFRRASSLMWMLRWPMPWPAVSTPTMCTGAM